MQAALHALEGGGKAYVAVCALLSLLRRRPVTRNRSAAALAAFVAVFRLLRAREVNDRAAGAAAGAVALLTSDESSRTGLLAHAGIHAARACWREGVESDLLPRIPHLDVLLLGAAGARMTTAWLWEVGTFDAGHVRSLDYFSAIPPAVLAQLREGLPSGALGGVCDAVHGGRGCAEHALTTMWPTLLQRAVRVYLPVHVVTGVLLRPGSWRRPEDLPRNLRQLAERIARSCLFLALFYQVPMAFACAASGSGRLRAGVGLGGALGALGILLEPPSRRAAIIPVSCAYALVSAARGLGVRGSTASSVAVFAASCAVLVRCKALPKSAHAFLDSPSSAPQE